jgi:mono/diheme cytochrome c family protein
VGAVLAVCAVLAAAGARAWTSDDPNGAAASESGKDLYANHCALCHGVDGTGNGPLAAAMKIAPADLTLVAARHDGTFPSAKVADVIRNGGGVLGHGSTAMLAWGRYFGELHKPEVGRARIKALTDYIESIQAK